MKHTHLASTSIHNGNTHTSPTHGTQSIHYNNPQMPTAR